MHRWLHRLKLTFWHFTQVLDPETAGGPNLFLNLPLSATSASTTGFWWNLSPFCTNTHWLIPVGKGSLWKQLLRAQMSQVTFTQIKKQSIRCMWTQTRKSAAMRESKFTFKFRPIPKTNYWHDTLFNRGDRSLLSSSSLHSWIFCSASEELKNQVFPQFCGSEKPTPLKRELESNSTRCIKSVQIQEAIPAIPSFLSFITELSIQSVSSLLVNSVSLYIFLSVISGRFVFALICQRVVHKMTIQISNYQPLSAK